MSSSDSSGWSLLLDTCVTWCQSGWDKGGCDQPISSFQNSPMHIGHSYTQPNPTQLRAKIVCNPNQLRRENKYHSYTDFFLFCFFCLQHSMTQVNVVLKLWMFIYCSLYWRRSWEWRSRRTRQHWGGWSRHRDPHCHRTGLGGGNMKGEGTIHLLIKN